MAAIKIIILCGLIAVALGFTLPEHQEAFDQEQAFVDDAQFEDALILNRVARSPQGNIKAGMEHSSRHGTSGTVKYTHPLNDRMDAYVSASRNFKYNDNSGHVGLSYKF